MSHEIRGLPPMNNEPMGLLRLHLEIFPPSHQVLSHPTAGPSTGQNMLYLSSLYQDFMSVVSYFLLLSVITLSYFAQLSISWHYRAHWGSHKLPVSWCAGHALVGSDNQCPPRMTWAFKARREHGSWYLVRDPLACCVWERVLFPLCEWTAQHEMPREMSLARRSNTQKKPQAIDMLENLPRIRIFIGKG